MNAESAIYGAVAQRPAYVNWDLVNQAIITHTGMPTPIGHRYELVR
jgi:hypothetical protein